MSDWIGEPGMAGDANGAVVHPCTNCTLIGPPVRSLLGVGWDTKFF